MSDEESMLVLSDLEVSVEDVGGPFRHNVEDSFFGPPKTRTVELLPKPTSDCAKYCRKNCFELKLTENEKVLLMKSYKHEKVSDTKQALLNHFSSQKLAGSPESRISFKGHSLCHKYFCKITGISPYLVKSVIKLVDDGVTVVKHGNTGSKKVKLATVNFISWILVFTENFGQKSPTDEKEIIIPKFLYKSELYKLYKTEVRRPVLSQSSFYEQFREQFGPFRKDKNLPQVTISNYSTHSICDTCLGISQYMRGAKCDAQRELARAMKIEHQAKYSGARMEVSRKIQYSLNFHSEVMCIQIDSMDNQKSYLPRFLENGKHVSGLFRIPCKITGVIVHSGFLPDRRTVRFYCNHTQFENGSSMIVSVLFRVLSDFLKEHKTLPNRLVLNVDNTVKENKNRYIFAFMAALVKKGVFAEVDIDFLVVGHTGNEVDQCFSILANEFRKNQINTLEELMKLIEDSPIHPKPTCESLPYIWEWRDYSKPKLTKTLLINFSFYNSFKIANAGNVVKLWAKRLPQDKNLVPEGGLKVLKDCVTFEKVPSAQFRVETLNIDKVISDLTKYLQCLPVMKRRQVASSWERLKTRLESMPLKHLRPMDLDELVHVKQCNVAELPDEYRFLEITELPEIDGERCKSTLEVGLDVVVYTRDKNTRPWIGRVVEVISDESFKIQWFVRCGKSEKFIAENKNGKLHTDVLENVSIMFRGIAKDVTNKSFRISYYWMKKVMEAYKSHDESYM